MLIKVVVSWAQIPFPNPNTPSESAAINILHSSPCCSVQSPSPFHLSTSIFSSLLLHIASLINIFLQPAALHEARVGLLGCVPRLSVGDRRGGDTSAGQQAAEGLQAVLSSGKVWSGGAVGVHHLIGGPEHLCCIDACCKWVWYGGIGWVERWMVADYMLAKSGYRLTITDCI